MPRDLGSWAFWISLFALIAMYPVSVLANLTTPRLKNWWAARPARSRASLQKTLAELESELAEVQRREPITDVESFILGRLAQQEVMQIRSDYLTMICFMFFGGFALSIVNALKIPLTHSAHVMIGIFIVWLILVSIMNTVELFTRVKYYKLFRLPEDERRLKAFIEVLRRHLRAKSE